MLKFLSDSFSWISSLMSIRWLNFQTIEKQFQIYLRFFAASSDRNFIYFRWKNPFPAEANILSKHSPLFKYNLSSSCTLSGLKMRRCCDGRCWLSFADGSGWLDDILKTFCSHSLWNTWTFLDTLLSSLSFPEGCGSRTRVFHLPNEHVIILPSYFSDNSVNLAQTKSINEFKSHCIVQNSITLEK